MFRLDNLLEDWATRFKPLSHDPAEGAKHKTFYRIDRLGGDNGFARNFNTTPSPCMAFPTSIDAKMGRNAKQISYHHGFYFMVKQASASLSKTNHSADLDAADCKAELNDLATALLAYLFELRAMARKKLRGETYTKASKMQLVDIDTYTKADCIAIAGLELEEAEWWTVPELYNRWWVLGIEFVRTESRELCVNEEQYHP